MEILNDSIEQAQQIGWNELFQQFVSDLFINEDDNETSKPKKDQVDVSNIKELGQDGAALSFILKQLKNEISFSKTKYAGNLTPNKLPESKHLSVLSAGLALYLESALSKPQYAALSTKISATAAYWLGSFMRLEKASQGKFTRNEADARLLVCRAAFHTKFPTYKEVGYKAMGEGIPVIYCTTQSCYDAFSSRLRYSLGLPSSSFRLVGSSEDLEAVIQKDLNESRQPLAVFAMAGEGHWDDLQKLRGITNNYNLWMNVEGADLALLLTFPPEQIAAVKTADSFTINPCDWYGLDSPSHCTFFLHEMPAELPCEQDELLALSLWITMQYAGQHLLSDIISQANTLSTQLTNALNENSSIQVYSPPGSLSVLFRYVPVTVPARPWESDPDFLNNLNQQLLMDLNASAIYLGLDISRDRSKCHCMRFKPLFHAELMSISPNNIKQFTDGLKQVTSCINATLSCAPYFEEIIQNYPSLHIGHVRNFVGLGAVQFLPELLKGKLLSDAVSKEIDALNSELASQLAAKNAIFSPGQTTDGSSCILVGVETSAITNEQTLNIANVIQETATHLKITEKVEKNIDDMVQQGIKAAEARMQKENEENLQQQGLVRKMPIIGSFVSWLSPVKVETNAKAFDICSSSLTDVALAPSPNNKNNNNENNNTTTAKKVLDFPETAEELPSDLIEQIQAIGDDNDNDDNDDDNTEDNDDTNDTDSKAEQEEEENTDTADDSNEAA